MKSRKGKKVLRGLLLAVLILLIEWTFQENVQAEETERAETSVQIMIYGSRNNVEFQVKGEDGKAVKGASIDIRNQAGEWLFYGTTESTGRKSLWMPLSTQTYRVYKAGHETVQGKFTVKNLLSKVNVKVVLKKIKTPKPEKPVGGNAGGNKETGGGGDTAGGADTSGTEDSHPGNIGGSTSERGKTSAANEEQGEDEASSEQEKKGDREEKEKQPEEANKKDKTQQAEEESTEEAGSRSIKEVSKYEERVDLAVNVYKTDGSPAEGVMVELHSKIWRGRLNEDGFILFPSVEVGDHVLYIKNNLGKTLAQKAFTVRRSNITSLESDSVVSVGIAVSEVTVNLEYGEDGQARLKSAWEGLNDRTGKRISKEEANEARRVEENVAQRIIEDYRILLSLLFLLLLFLSGYFAGSRQEKKRFEKEESAKRIRKTSAGKETKGNGGDTKREEKKTVSVQKNGGDIPDANADSALAEDVESGERD